MRSRRGSSIRTRSKREFLSLFLSTVHTSIDQSVSLIGRFDDLINPRTAVCFWLETISEVHFEATSKLKCSTIGYKKYPTLNAFIVPKKADSEDNQLVHKRFIQRKVMRTMVGSNVCIGYNQSSANNSSTNPPTIAHQYLENSAETNYRSQLIVQSQRKVREADSRHDDTCDIYRASYKHRNQFTRKSVPNTMGRSHRSLVALLKNETGGTHPNVVLMLLI